MDQGSMTGTTYLDHQASTPVDPRVLAAMEPWWRAQANPHASNAAGRRAHDAVEAARREVAAAIGADPVGVILTSGATEAASLALRGFLHGPGDACVTSAIEHACVRGTLGDLRGRGVRVTTVGVDGEGIIDLERLAEEIEAGPTLASIMAVNNEVGTIQPFRDIGRLCEGAGVLFHTDATQAVGKLRIDVDGDRIDLLGLSAHKLHGPQGVGALYCRPDLRGRLRPAAVGGGQEGGARPGTVPVALAVGLGAACGLAVEGMAAEGRRLHALRDAFLARLAAEGVDFEVNGSLPDRIPGNLNVRLPGVDADLLLRRLPDLCLSTGSACDSGAIAPSHVLTAMGLPVDGIDSSIRIGFGRDTTEAGALGAARRIAEEVAGILAGARSDRGAPRRPASGRQRPAQPQGWAGADGTPSP